MKSFLAEIKHGCEYTENLMKFLKEAAKLSKDPKNESLFLDEALSSNLLEFLKGLTEKKEKETESDEKLEIINLLITTLKNNASNQSIRAKFFETKNLETLGFFFHFFSFDEKTRNLLDSNAKNTEFDKRTLKIFEIYTNLTGLFRNLAIDSECISRFLEIQVYFFKI